MKYCFSRIIDASYDETLKRVIESMKAEGFGVLTEIDVKATLKKKLDVDFRNYKILGACNPPFAYKALQAERMIGAMLPCNIIVQDAEQGGTEIAAIDPIASMTAIENPDLADTAETVRQKLKKVIDNT